jgi:hypothetical protein
MPADGTAVGRADSAEEIDAQRLADLAATLAGPHTIYNVATCSNRSR